MPFSLTSHLRRLCCVWILVASATAQLGSSALSSHHFMPTDERDVYLGAVGFALSNLAYDNSEVRSSPPIGNIIPPFLSAAQQAHIKVQRKKEKQWLRALQPKEYKVWNYVHSEVLDYDATLSQAITGLVEVYDHHSDTPSVWTGEYPKRAFPFVAFRGTTSPLEWTYNLQTIVESDVDRMGAGFSVLLQRLLDLQGHTENVTIVNEVARLMSTHGNRLIVAGHSLGGGAANLFVMQLQTHLESAKAGNPALYAALHTDVLRNPGVRLVTFASPRAVASPLTETLNAMHGVHLRFVNIADAITVGMREKFKHAGVAIFPFDPLRGVHEDTDALPAVSEHKYMWRTIYDPKTVVDTPEDDPAIVAKEKMEQKEERNKTVSTLADLLGIFSPAELNNETISSSSSAPSSSDVLIEFTASSELLVLSNASSIDATNDKPFSLFPAGFNASAALNDFFSHLNDTLFSDLNKTGLFDSIFPAFNHSVFSDSNRTSPLEDFFSHLNRTLFAESNNTAFFDSLFPGFNHSHSLFADSNRTSPFDDFFAHLNKTLFSESNNTAFFNSLFPPFNHSLYLDSNRTSPVEEFFSHLNKTIFSDFNNTAFFDSLFNHSAFSPSNRTSPFDDFFSHLNKTFFSDFNKTALLDSIFPEFNHSIFSDTNRTSPLDDFLAHLNKTVFSDFNKTALFDSLFADFNASFLPDFNASNPFSELFHGFNHSMPVFPGFNYSKPLLSIFDNALDNFDAGISPQLKDFHTDLFAVHRLQTSTGYGSVFHSYLKSFRESDRTLTVVERNTMELIQNMCLVENYCSYTEEERVVSVV